MIAYFKGLNQRTAMRWRNVSPSLLPFADAASEGLSLRRLLRLSLFQVSVGMATVLMVGTLNRVMIVELGMAAWLVSLMVALPLVAAPFRALIGFKSDTHRSVLGWRRVPYLWSGSMLQFGGLAIMPFTLILLSAESHVSPWIGQTFGALAFLLVGAGLQITQTAGLALATDLADEKTRPRVVALMYVMLLVGMLASGLLFGLLLDNFSNTRLVQVVQGSAVLTMALNLFASWKQEPRRVGGWAPDAATPDFKTQWRALVAAPGVKRFLVATGLGSAAFSMQDIILEPYGGEILKLGVAATTTLTAIMAFGALCAFWIASRVLNNGFNPYRLAAIGLLIGLPAFSLVIFAEPLQSPTTFRIGTLLIGFGGGLFAVSTLISAMGLDSHLCKRDESMQFNGLALGAWGAVQATCSGVAIAIGGALRDAISALATSGALGEVLATPAAGYSFVYHLEIVLLFLAIIAVGPLVKVGNSDEKRSDEKRSAKTGQKFGLSDLPT